MPPAPPFAPSWRHDPWGVVPRSLGRRLGRVHVGFLLGLGDVFFVADPLVAKPVIDLGGNTIILTVTKIPSMPTFKLNITATLETII